MDNIDLMDQRIAALYVHDVHGRLAAINQWDGGSVPFFYLGRTASERYARFRHDLPTHVVGALQKLCDKEPSAADLRKPPVNETHYLELIEPIANNAELTLWSGPAYHFPPLQPTTYQNVVAITQHNAHLLNGGLEDWLPDVPHRQPFFAAVESDRAVAVCASVRITTNAHEAGVETLPGFRRRGHAARVVEAWANAVFALGATPFYSTAWSNTASQNVARALKLEHFGTDFHISAGG